MLSSLCWKPREEESSFSMRAISGAYGARVTPAVTPRRAAPGRVYSSG